MNYTRLVHSAYPFAPDLVKSGEQRIASLGGCDLKADGGPVFQRIYRVLGWKAARRAQVLGRMLRNRAKS